MSYTQRHTGADKFSVLSYQLSFAAYVFYYLHPAFAWLVAALLTTLVSAVVATLQMLAGPAVLYRSSQAGFWRIVRWGTLFLNLTIFLLVLLALIHQWLHGLFEIQPYSLHLSDAHSY